MSSGDNSNIIAARVARETFGIQQVVARIYDPGRAEVYQRLGITDRGHREVDRRPGAAPAAAGRSGAGLPGPVRHDARRPGADARGSGSASGRIHFQEQTDSRIAWIDRLGEGMLPDRESMLQEGDVIHLVMREENAAHVFQVIDDGPEER